MTRLDALPAELVILIAEFARAAKGTLAPLAATCQQFQPHIEGLIWRALRITDAEVVDFERLTTPSRFLAIRELIYHIELVSTGHHSHDASSERITSDQADAYNASFTEAVRAILTALRDKSADASANHPGLCLVLAGSCDLEPDHNRYNHSEESQDRPWIRLLEHCLPDNLSVPAVTSFRNRALPGRLARYVWPPSWASIMAHCPNITTVDVEVFDNDRKNLSSRNEARDAFGESLSALPPQLAELTLEYFNEPPGNEFYDPPVLTNGTQGFDVFSHQLGSLASRLVKLNITGTTMDLMDFFKSCSLSGCPHLEELLLLYQQAASADGSWYFELDPRMTMEEFLEDHQDPDARDIDDLRLQMKEHELPAPMDVPYNPFRTSTDPAKFREIYLAAADAVRRMPKLLVFEIYFQLMGQSGFGEGEHEFRYRVGNDDMWCRSSTADVNLGWGLIPMISLDHDVVEAWRNVGHAVDRSVKVFTRDDWVGYDRWTVYDASS